eukprot:2413712-Rhodomonas_salina.1
MSASYLCACFGVYGTDERHVGTPLIGRPRNRSAVHRPEPGKSRAYARAMPCPVQTSRRAHDSP